MRIEVKHNLHELKRQVGQRFANQVPFATAQALTMTVKDVQTEIPSELERVFDNPKPFTKRGTFIKAARKDDLVAIIGFKQRQAAYLTPQIKGGRRQQKRFEQRLEKLGSRYVIPSSKAKLDAYGNLSRAQLRDLYQAARSAGRSNKRGTFMVDQKGGDARTAHLPPGIYARINNNKKLLPLALFSDSSNYRARFDFASFAKKIVHARFARNFDEAIMHAIRTAR